MLRMNCVFFFLGGGGVSELCLLQVKDKAGTCSSINYQALSGRYQILINGRGSYQNRRRDTFTISTKIRVCLIPIAFNQRFG